jgi:hypothetical protein
VVFATLYIFSLMGLLVNLISDLIYTWIDPRIDFEEGGLSDGFHRLNKDIENAGYDAQAAGRRRPPPGTACRRSTSGAGNNFKANRRGYWSLWIFLVLFSLSLFAEFIANDRRSSFPTRARSWRRSGRLSGRKVRRLLGVTDYRDPFIQEEIEANGWMLWPPIRYSYPREQRHSGARAPIAAVLDAGQGRSAVRATP